MNYGISIARPRTFNYNGSDCTLNGARTLTVSRNVGSDALVVVGGRVLMDTNEYTTSGAVITFLVEIDDSDKIMVKA
jgi:hypothetical protein